MFDNNCSDQVWYRRPPETTPTSLPKSCSEESFLPPRPPRPPLPPRRPFPPLRRTGGERASERASILICQPVACVLFNPRPKVIIATICRSQSRPCCYGPPERPLGPPSLGDFRLWALRLPSLPRCDRRWQSIGLLQFHKNRRKK